MYQIFQFSGHLISIIPEISAILLRVSPKKQVPNQPWAWPSANWWKGFDSGRSLNRCDWTWLEMAPG
jgi:hypothetical protein